MNFLRLKKNDDSNFDMAWELYQEAFPEEEKRSINQQIQILENENYYFEVIFRAKEFIGIILWWNFKNLRFVDHFAVHHKHRGMGYGKSILKDFHHQAKSPILLEVELPTNNINKRRINFYEHLGYKVNNFEYYMPSYSPEGESVKLLLMSYPDVLEGEKIDTFINSYQPIIYQNF